MTSALPDYTARYGEWALVLGGSEGLGRAIACDLAARGMKIALVARREAPLRDAATMISQTFGVETRTICVDLSRADVVAQLEAGLGGTEVSFMVYNAAAEPFGRFVELGLDEHLFNIAVNITTPTRLVHHFGNAMARRGKGGIVLCGSLAGAMGLHLWVGYGAAKAYEDILGQGLWDELADRGVDACTLMIGTTWTDSFQRTQKKLGGVFAESRTPAGLPDWMALPQLPEDASANLFHQIDREWLPVVFANPEDERRSAASAVMPRDELIRMAAHAQQEWYK